MWTSKQEVIEAFKTSSMWVEWVKAGYSDCQLRQSIGSLRVKYLKSPKIISGMTVGSGRVELCAGGCMTRGIPGIFDIFPLAYHFFQLRFCVMWQGDNVSSAASMRRKVLTTRH